MLNIEYCTTDLALQEEEKEFIRSCFAETDYEDNDSSAKSVLSEETGEKSIIAVSDPRRSFASNFESILNSGDKEGLRSMFRSVCTKDLVVTIDYPKGKNPHGPSFRELNGVEAASSYFEMAFLSVPDAIFLIHKTKLCVLPNNTSSVISKYSFSGSRLHFVNLLKSHGPQINKQEVTSPVSPTTNNSKTQLQPLKFTDKSSNDTLVQHTVGEFVQPNKKTMAFKTLGSASQSRKRKIDASAAEGVWKVGNDDKVELSPMLPAPVLSKFVGVINMRVDAAMKIYRIDCTAVL